MIAETGHFALVLAVAAAIIQTLFPLWGAARGDARLMRLAVPASLAQLFLIALAFGILMHGYLTSDFSILNVATNSHTQKPLLYKISGVWGNHEGSMLLWVLILALCGAAVAVFGTALPLGLKARVLAVQGSIGVAFLLFVLITSNPFTRLFPVPIEGNGLNPLLQDPALAFHPPFLYVGYVGLSVAFSFAIAALLEGRVDPAWARWVRPWTLLAWMFLTIGIAMGSWWAYYELGWGGWWFWDPVENASFMPWLVATALLHSSLVVEKRNALKIWTILLSILAFSLSLLGTFLVRSGVLTSVHAFAVDPERGVFVLGILGVFVGGALILFAWRAPSLKAGGLFAPISREGAIVLNNFMLCLAAATVLFGTLYPVLVDALTGEKMTVGPPYFNIVFGTIMAPLFLIVPFGPLLAWKRGDLVAAMQRLWFAGLVALLVLVAGLAFLYRGPWLAPLGLALGLWLILGAMSDFWQRIRGGATGHARWQRARGLAPSAFGTMLAHAGVGILVIGVVVSSVWKAESVQMMKVGETTNLAGYSIKLQQVARVAGPNYDADQGVFVVSRGGAHVTDLVAERRMFRPSNRLTSEVGLRETLAGDLYIVLGDPVNDGFTVRITWHPMILFIWIGGLVMFLGGLLSLSDRRFRIGAPRPARGPVLAPAE